MSVEVRRAGDRFVTERDGIVSRHGFSFGQHYDPANVGHGLLRVHNDDLLAPGAGYDTHRHADTEIVTWVVEGRLAHEDSAGHTGVLRPGVVQRTSAGSGIEHAERNASETEPLRFVQMHLSPDEPAAAPSYEQGPVDLPAGCLVTIASGRADRPGVVRLGSARATLLAARLERDDAVLLPEAPLLHVYVTRGAAGLDGAGLLYDGDEARLTDEGPRRLTSTAAGTHVLVWEMGIAE
ncbi:MAG TPA: pirin family protein [Nocardioidaceae bacterium]|nr:pirin family protein [Nocardioidaceae bacterium]